MSPRIARVTRIIVTAVIAFLPSRGVALAQRYKALHTFVLATSDGAQPFAGLIQGSDGNFYGTTGNGGSSGVGTVFKMNTAGVVTILHSFVVSDGMFPKGSVVQGTDGFLYGTTSAEGTLPGGGGGVGTVFKISTDGTSFTNLHTFGGPEGAGPLAGLVQGADGAFYGTTAVGGTGLAAAGTVFKITSTGTLTSLHTFTGPDGRNPKAPLIQATDGSFYGTAEEGGTAGFNTAVHGTTFKITSTGAFTLLHTFTFPTNLNEGSAPTAPLLQAADGNFYGTTYTGGTGHSGFGGDGTVFRMDPAGNVTTIHHFNRTDGRYPLGGLIQTADGAFYGTTSSGDNNFNTGTVFRMTATGGVTTLHNFFLSSEYGPPAGVVRGTDGDLYGLTQFGGQTAAGVAFGVAFRVKVPVRSDIAVFRQSTGQWIIRRSAGGITDVVWGTPALGDRPVPADFDGDGKADISIYRTTTGEWFVIRSSNSTLLQVGWGAPALGDTPVINDYDGDGKADVAVYRLSTGEWFVIRSSNSTLLQVAWGAPQLGDVPIVGDYDADGKADVAVYRPSTGQGFVIRSSSSTLLQLSLGTPQPGDRPVPGDYDGDGRTDLAVYRESTGEWFIRRSSDGALASIVWGWPPGGDVVAAADYDADGITDIGVYRGTTGEWFIRRSSDGGLTSLPWGWAPGGDMPVTGAY